MLDFFPDVDIANSVRNFAVAFIPAFLGIILHEVGHGWAALHQGDRTAKLMGRLTLNPFPHIDPLGLIVFILTSLSGSFVFGWAKPVPVDPRNFRNPSKGMMIVSLAGPGTNIVLAILFGLLLKISLVLMPPLTYQSSQTYIFLLSTLQAGIMINLCLAFLNLLPIPPLDGSKVISYFLPPRTAYSYLSTERYGFLILMILIVAGVLNKILGPVLQGSFQLILKSFGII